MNAMPQPSPESRLHIETLEQKTNGFSMSWSDGHSSFFHHVWLRDCCYCESCGDCYSSKRYVMPCDVPLDVMPKSARITDIGDLLIEWQPDGHRSTYEAEWLRLNCYDDAARRERRKAPTLWDSSLLKNLPEMNYADAETSDDGLLDLYRTLRDYGVAIVRNGPTEPGSVEKIANLVGDLGENAYGKIFDLSPSSKIRTLGNTTRPVPPHTDEAFRYSPPGMMVLGCVRKADDGGDTILVDGFKLAAIMRDRFPESFDMLSGKDQTFVRKHDGSLDQRARVRVIVTDDEGNVCGVRIHTRSYGPLDLPAQDVEAYYEAQHQLTSLMMDPANQLRLTLESGDFAVFDNHRVLHARTDFTDPLRHLQICSVDRQQFHERLRLLAGKLGYTQEAEMVLSAGASC